MNKKLFLGMFAAAGMLLATSCSNDELDAVQSGNEAQVTFSIGLEGGIATRAISDGTGAKKLICAVYDANESLLDKVVINNQQVDANGQYVNTDAFKGGLKDNISITLAKGQTYTIAFWAQNGGCDAYDTDDLKAVKVDYTNGAEGTSATGDINNDDTRDAFFAAETFKVEGDKEINVTLKRPFAQINVGVTDADWKAAEASGIVIEKSAVVIKNAATSINLLTGAVGDETTDVEVSYVENAIPADPATLEVDANKDGFIGEDEKYHWLSMSYILVADHDDTEDENGLLGTDKATLQGLKYTFTPQNGTPIEFAEGLAGAPVRRNWRTNILGKILTGDIQFNITIDPVYDGDYIYPDGGAQELMFAAAFGGTVTLQEDVTLDAPLNVTADMVINLNGKTITSAFSDKKNDVINNNGILKLVGGKVQNTASNGAAVITNSGILVLDGVEIVGAPIADDSYPDYAVYTTGNLVVEEGTKISSDRGAINMSGEANVTINGGDIKVTNALNGRVLTTHVIYAGGNSELTINGGDFALNYAAAGNTGASVICPAGATIDIFGGNFTYGGEAGQSGVFQNYMGYGKPVNVYGGTYNDNTVTKNLAKGYKSINSNGLYVVVPEDVDAVAASANDLQTALTDGKSVLLVDDITSETTVKGYGLADIKLNGGVLDGNGKTLSVNSNNGGDYAAILTTGGTIKNLTIDNGFRAIFLNDLTQDVLIENVVLHGKGVGYCINTGTMANRNFNLTVNKSTLDGWTSFNGLKSVTFNDCSFGQGEYYSDVYGRLVKPYVNTVFENCEFSSKFYIDLSALIAGETVTLKNCTINGVKLTSNNWSQLIAPESNCGEGQISVELTNGSYLTTESTATYFVIE